ncbi:dephospho-CoA kinase [Basidiobolus meristosporus CBS 931.73]|uniref:Dephospho-CoA kinase n=1 Tax=Basidiobolus meristosporus CBS 931.73 TaxID=1314790 RepID=A0A1Y1YG10_9FUNG|nr:dephospho-CoA kinase [Basidiobolus meristosporus CBS 931.73]|eukprot:ORX96929.1 dephospho-CoA kinase [Basidiobolus meristosporus CBS 931.73]
MRVVGLTGGISTGKSTVSRMLSEAGYPIIDADLIAREILYPGKPAYNKIVKTFSTEILQANGEIDRAKLGALVFSDESARKKLNSCTHPYVKRRMVELVLYYYVTGHSLVFLDVPLLYEAKLDKFVSCVVVVYCSTEAQLQRLIKRDGSTAEAAQDRINAQMSIEEKKGLADIVIHNTGTIQETQEQVKALLHKLQPSAFATAFYLAAPVISVASLLLGIKYWYSR